MTTRKAWADDVDGWRADNEAYGHPEDPEAEANAALRMAVNLALIAGGAVDMRHVSIVALGGVVTLTGRVPAWQRPGIAEALKGVAGIRELRDHLIGV